MFTAFDRVWPLVGLALALATIVCWMTLSRPLGNQIALIASFSHSQAFRGCAANRISSIPITTKRYGLETGKSQNGEASSRNILGQGVTLASAILDRLDTPCVGFRV